MDDYTAVVYEIQSYLRSISRLHPEISAVIPDGIYGKETVQAVRDFQKLVGLPQTGKVDLDTWNMLVKESNKAQHVYSKPIQVAPISNKDLPLKMKDNNDFVRMLQHMLMHVSNRHDNIPPVKVTGVFDEATRDALCRWQGVCSLPQTGDADKDTWNYLARFYTM